MSERAVRGSTARKNQLTVSNKNRNCATHRLHSHAKAIEQCPDVTSRVLLYKQSLWLEFWTLNSFSNVIQCTWHVLVGVPSMRMPHVYAVCVEISLIMFLLRNSWHPTNHECKITNWKKTSKSTDSHLDTSMQHSHQSRPANWNCCCSLLDEPEVNHLVDHALLCSILTLQLTMKDFQLVFGLDDVEHTSLSNPTID